MEMTILSGRGLGVAINIFVQRFSELKHRRTVFVHCVKMSLIGRKKVGGKRYEARRCGRSSPGSLVC